MFGKQKEHIGSSKKQYSPRDFQNIPPFEENFEQFRYFNFNTNFLGKENLFQKTRLSFFSGKY